MNEKIYTLAIRKRENGDRFFQSTDYQFQIIKINTHGRYWLADPFIFELNGTVFLFYEAFDLVLQRGRIGYSRLLPDGSFTDPKIIIKGGHKSFPFICQKGKDIFIMPESCEDKNICLFKAVRFPDEWCLEAVLVKDVFATDSVLFKSNHEEYLLSSEQYLFPPKGRVISCWVKNRLYPMGQKMGKDTGSAIGKIIGEGEKGIRNAGAVFKYSNKLIRPGQDCSDGIYGRGLILFEIESVEPYREKPFFQVDCKDMQNHILFRGDSQKLLGCHTYNASENYEIIDLSYWGKIPGRIRVTRNMVGAVRKLRCHYRGARAQGRLFFEKVRKKILGGREDSYEAVVDREGPWIFVSYIADPFYHKDDQSYINLHQNKREALVMAKVFNELGFNAYFMLHSSGAPIPDRNFKAVFGHEPNIQRAKDKYPHARMIYYGVSTYFSYRNNKIRSMTDAFNFTYHAHIPPRRLVKPHDSVRNADAVLLIGSENTVRTYPEEYRKKITKIHQSTQPCKYLRNVEGRKSNEFLFLASSGNILKGVQAAAEYFSIHPEYELHWVGPVEKDVISAMQHKLTPNIHTYGFQDMGSDIVLGLMERCSFLLYPSAVEGVPGSVLNTMKSGLIPLVTPWASFDGIEDYGFVMEDSNPEGVEAAVNWAVSLSLEEIDRRKKACQKFVLENYNIDKFEQEFYHYMKIQLEDLYPERTWS